MSMSRVAKYPVDVPKGVEVALSDAEISVKGPLGTLITTKKIQRKKAKRHKKKK